MVTIAIIDSGIIQNYLKEGTYEYGEVPIAVEYSINGEIYGTIITFCIVSERSEEDVYYGINQVIHTDNLDAYHVYDD